jgi:hypothetical protein
MRFCVLSLFLVGIGCSSRDDCQTAAAKLRPLVEDRARLHGELAPGARMSEADKDLEVDKLADQCRTKRKLHPDDPMPTMKCVLAATDEAAVRACEASAHE